VKNIDDLARDLDQLYALTDWESDPSMSRFVPRLYQEIGYDYVNKFCKDFCRRFNGLMLRAADTVKQVYCASFPTPDVIEKLLEICSGEALLFLHHPLDMETGGGGLLPIAPTHLDALISRGVSVYACHAPMDAHDQYGTNISIINALQAQKVQPFLKYGAGFAGRIGEIDAISVSELALRCRDIFGIDRVAVGGAVSQPITKVAVVAGGGDDPEIFKEAEALGAQAYLSGEWFTRLALENPEARAWAVQNGQACRNYVEGSKMAFLAVSHAASEFLVMRKEMKEYFRDAGLDAMEIPQKNWWR
jgi:putative NIF3 family GTP cyclohydrolase 1 type 2